MNQKSTANYHTHTYRCGHATGDAAEYAEAAVKAGLRVLGISDHTPLPNNWMGSVRMRMDELDGYVSAIESVDIPGLTVLKGMECDVRPEHFGFYEDELLGKRGFHYLIGALHWYRHRGEWVYAGNIPNSAHLRSYADELIHAMEWGRFAFIAHPDHFAAGWKSWDADAESCSKDLLEAASATGSLLEINGNGFRKPKVEGETGLRRPYPWRPFWELAASYGVNIIYNSDAHRPQDVAASMELCHALAEEAGLEIGSFEVPYKTVFAP